MPNASHTSRDRFVGELLARSRLARHRRIPLAIGLLSTVYRNLRAGVDSRSLTTDGLAPALTAHGQRGEAFRHIRFHAACGLLGPLGQVASWGAELLDRRQLAGGKSEAEAEIAGNEAGRAVGEVLRSLCSGSLTPSRAAGRMRAVLSGFPLEDPEVDDRPSD